MGRLILGKVLVAALLICVIPALVSQVTSVVANRTIQKQVDTDAAAIARTLRHGPAGWRLTADPYSATSLARDNSAAGYSVVDAAGRVVLGSSTPVLSETLVLQMANRLLEAHDTYTYAVRPVVQGSERATVVVYRDRTCAGAFVDEVVRAIVPYANMLVVLVLAAALAVSVGILLYTARGLSRAVEQATRIDTYHLDARIDTASLPDDLARLVRATNDALDRVEEGFRFQSRFAAAISHELRTPIAILRLKCELLPPSEQRDGILAAVDRQVHILKQLIALASVEGNGSQPERIDLAAVARDAAADMAMEVVRSGRTIEFDAPPGGVHVLGNADYVTTIVYNLVGNSIRHTDPGTHIAVCVGADGTLDVVDNGAGIVCSETLGRVGASSKYARADHDRTSEGTGLGLRIVARSVILMHGKLSVITDSPGAHVRVQLALSPGEATASAVPELGARTQTRRKAAAVA